MPSLRVFTIQQGAGLAADDKEAALNDNSDADAVAFSSALLVGGYITYEDG